MILRLAEWMVRSIRFVPVVGFLVLLVVLFGSDPERTSTSSRVEGGDLAVAFLMTMSALLAVILSMLFVELLNLH